MDLLFSHGSRMIILLAHILLCDQRFFSAFNFLYICHILNLAFLSFRVKSERSSDLEFRLLSLLLLLLLVERRSLLSALAVPHCVWLLSKNFPPFSRLIVAWFLGSMVASIVFVQFVVVHANCDRALGSAEEALGFSVLLVWFGRALRSVGVFNHFIGRPKMAHTKFYFL